jgi:flagellin
MLSIQTNVAALSAQNNLTSTNNNLQKSMERLSSGFRINRAADDAAGLAISQKMQAQIGGLNQAVRNANDGVSMIQTAEGALDQVQTMMQRVRNLSVQAASDTNGDNERYAIDVEIQQLKSEVDNISSRTTFNGLGLLDGTLVAQQSGGTAAVSTTALAGTETIAKVDVSGATASTTYTLSFDGTSTMTLTSLNAAGETSTSTADVSGGVAANSSATLKFDSLGVSITLNNATNTAITGATVGADLGTAGLTVETAADHQFAILQTGADATAANTTNVSLLDTRLTSGTSKEMTDLAATIQTFHIAASNNTAKASDATALITSLDTALNWVSSKRADLGAAQNRLGYAAASLSTTSQNVSAANSQIRDADVASETANMSKSQILMQAGISVLAQANQASQLALKLLNG